jgi:hypothetical protein
MTRGLQERGEAMQRRARALAEQVIEQNQVWVRQLGIAPSDPLAREQWIEAVTAVAAYRDRWKIDDDHRPLGSKVAGRTIEAINQRNLAQAAVNMASRLAYPQGAQCPELVAIAVDINRTGGPEL